MDGHGLDGQDVGAESHQLGRLAGFTVRDGLDERDADALAIEGAHEAEARGRQSDAPAGRGNKDVRGQRFLRS
jgi:hypothetical protein